MEMMRAIAEIDAKRFLRVSWVAHVWFLLAVSAAVIVFWPDRVGGWASVLPLLETMVGAEWAAAAGGGSLKRLTEARLEQAKCAKPDTEREVSEGEKA